MKKWMFFSIVFGLVLAMTGCGSSQSPTASATATTALSLEGQLLVGTFRLESTNLAVTSSQADQLLPLWETLQSLASSGTAATQEVDAVLSQIESSMSAEQISSITAMNLTQADLAAIASDSGAATTASSSTSVNSAGSIQSQTGAGMPADGGPGGNPPVDMGGSMPTLAGDQTGSQAQNGTAQSLSAQSTGAASQVSAAMINTLVELLKKKIG